MRDPHEVLGVPWNADPRHIRAAYRKRAAELHPDRNSADDATDRLKEVVEAYRFLTDPVRSVQHRQRHNQPRTATASAAATMDTAEFRRQQTFRYLLRKLINPGTNRFVPPRRLRCAVAVLLALLIATPLFSSGVAVLLAGGPQPGQTLLGEAIVLFFVISSLALILAPGRFAELPSWSPRRGFDLVQPDWLVESYGWIILTTITGLALPVLRAFF